MYNMSIKLFKNYAAYGHFGNGVYGIRLPREYTLVIRWK